MRLSFILVENTEIDLYIASKLINGIAGEVVVEKFLSSEDALEHIAFEKTKKADRTIILLDLMMPRLNGADFISQLLNGRFFALRLFNQINDIR